MFIMCFSTKWGALKSWAKKWISHTLLVKNTFKARVYLFKNKKKDLVGRQQAAKLFFPFLDHVGFGEILQRFGLAVLKSSECKFVSLTFIGDGLGRVLFKKLVNASVDNAELEVRLDARTRSNKRARDPMSGLALVLALDTRIVISAMHATQVKDDGI